MLRLARLQVPTEQKEDEMTKQEFESRLHGGMVSDREFSKISEVYASHPSIDAVKGKDQIAALFEVFGMRIIEDMLPTARKAAEMTEAMRLLRLQLVELKDSYERLKRGEV